MRGVAKQKILLVEKDRLLSKAIHICLSKRGYDVEVLRDMERATEYLARVRPAAVVLDLEGGDSEALLLAARLQKGGWAKNVPLILLSGSGAETSQVTDIGHCAHIEKPFDMGELVETIERSVKRPKVSSTS